MNECAECGGPSRNKYCRWQCQYPNRTEEPMRKQRWITLTLEDQTRTVPEWSKLTGLSAKLINHRRRRGWPPERILTTPKITSHGNAREKQRAPIREFLKQERARVHSMIAKHPEMTNEELGELVGRSESAVSRIRSRALHQPRRKSGRRLQIA